MDHKLNCVLLVDDDNLTNCFSNIVIKEAGCASHVEIKTSVEDALAYLVGCDCMTTQETEFCFPDLIFLDKNMPGKGGWDFIKLYKKLKDKFVKKPVIIMISSSIHLQDQVKAMRSAEVSDIVDKPLTIEILNEVLVRYFPGTF
ncbi:MAG: response regulator [Ferruginibacter sp.]|nr:response regulator [Ferruginibacter sp.]